MDEQGAMDRALECARQGWGRVHPNPLCGAVVLSEGVPVAEGYHAEFGGLHAERMALEKAEGRSRQSTLVVTLEPCTHEGKQPPCVPAIIQAGVRRVVIALRDPNPEAGGGVDLLRAAGLDVDVGLGAEQAAVDNAIFLHRHLDPSRPYVALKLATTLDGRIADFSGRSRWISGAEARAYVHWLRAGFDAIGVGGRTARMDDPSLTVRGALEPRRPPARVVFDSRASLPGTLRIVTTAREIPTYCVASPLADAGRRRGLEAAGVRVLVPDSLAAGLEALRAMGIGSLLVEGGGRLAAALLEADLVDRFYWIQSPLWLGDSGTQAVGGLPGRKVGSAHRWHVVDRRALDEDTLLVVDRKSCLPAS